MKTRQQKVKTNRIQGTLGVLNGSWFRDISLLVSLAALGWLCSVTASSKSRFAPAAERGARAEQSFDLLQTSAQELTLGQGWGAEHPRMLADVNGDKRQDVVGFGRDGVWLATSRKDGFAAAFVLPDFGYQSGWRVTRHVRVTGDLNGDKLEDLVGFGDAGVYRALSTGTGFGDATFVLADFGYNQGWRLDRHVRLLADVNGDGRKDIAAFGDDGVWLALATAQGSFTPPALVLAAFGTAQGWTSAKHLRTAADVNGDGRQDLVGFGDDGVWTALSTGNGFDPAQHVLADFGYSAGRWRLDRHPRVLVDINGDGRQDLVAFGDEGVWTALAADSGFAAAQLVLAEFGYQQGWRAHRHPRFVADLNGDGYQDLVGFGEDLIYRALGGPNGFERMPGVLRELAAERFPFNLDEAAQLAPRFVGDINGDGKQDLVAFDQERIVVAASSDLAPVPPNEAPLSSNVFGSRDPEANAAALSGGVINSVVLPQIELTPERGPAQPCSPQKVAEQLAALRAPATAAAPAVKIECSLTLRSSDVITKRLVFLGDAASGVTVEGNGATINGDRGTFNYNLSNAALMVEIGAEEYRDPATGARHWKRPVNVTLRNLKIKGSVGIYGDAGVPTTNPDYVTLARNNAPRNIVFDRVTITGLGLPCGPNSGNCNLLYLYSGVSYFQLLNSEINGYTSEKAVNIYLDDTSYRNTFRNNTIHAATKSREVMAIDGSSENLIINNHFSALNHGGIYLYRNCGEEGSMRRGTPSHNTIVNNFFYYDKYDGADPAIFVASRNGKSTKTYTCPPNFFDQAQHNVVMQNQIRKRSVGDMIKVGRPDFNTPNYINYNETVTEKLERKAGCYISNGYQQDFIRDGEFINLFRNANGEPVCTGYRLTCHDGVLTQASDSTCRAVGYLDFECQASNSNGGCQRTAFAPAGKTIIGAKAACNLEFGTVSATDLNGVFANFVKVLRASDNVSEGSCTLGSTSIRSGQAAVSGINGLTRLSFGCRENDANGGDCHIKGRLYYQ